MVPPLRRGDGRNMLRPYGVGGGGTGATVEGPSVALLAVPLRQGDVDSAGTGMTGKYQQNLAVSQVWCGFGPAAGEVQSTPVKGVLPGGG